MTEYDMTRGPDKDAINAAFRGAMDVGARPSIWTMTEAELQAEVIALCKRHRVRWIHVSTVRFNNAPDLKGFPDLQLIGRCRIAYRELKKQSGRMNPEQTTWKYALVATGADWDLWRPSDLESGRIEREITELNQPRRTAP